MIYLRKSREAEKLVHKHLVGLMWLFVILFFILLMRVGSLQILQGGYFRSRASENCIQLIPIPAPRGLILDRRGEVLVKNRPSFNVAIIRGRLSEETLSKTCQDISRILDLPESKLKERLPARNQPFMPSVLTRDVDIDKVVMIEENRLDLPGVFIQTEPLRTYVEGVACHLLGYLGRINPKELAELGEQGYEARDIIGKCGVERFYDQYLRGRGGGSQYEVDVRGNRLRSLGLKRPLAGRDLILTIDKQIQMKAEEALGENSGAVVVMDVTSGEVLALVSRPGFDPNLFLRKGCYPQIETLLKDPLSPFLNRAIAAQYPPGSLFKIVVSLAALDGGLIDSKRGIDCPGFWDLGGRRFKCWKEGGHGRVDITPAITHSCNTFFYQLGLKVGEKGLIDLARLLGLGEKTGIDLSGEKEGFLPSPAWKKRVYNGDWYGGDTVNLSIGQGFIFVTPLQMASLLAAVANGGRLFQPHLVKGISSSPGEPAILFQPHLRRKIHLSKYSLSILHQGLEGVVMEGTGQAAYLSSLKIAGKTGTAQSPRGKDHAWFAGFAPADDPKMVVVVLVEHGGGGGGMAAPIARSILEEIFYVKS